MNYEDVVKAFGGDIPEGQARRIAEALPVAAGVFGSSEETLLDTCVKNPDVAIKNLHAVYRSQVGLDRLYLSAGEVVRVEVFDGAGLYRYTVDINSQGVNVHDDPPDRSD